MLFAANCCYTRNPLESKPKWRRLCADFVSCHWVPSAKWPMLPSGFPLNVPPLLRIVVWLCLKLTVFYFPTWAENWLKEGFIYLRFIKDDFLGPERWLIGWEGLLCKCENLSLNQQYPLLMCSQHFKGRDRQIPRAHWPASVAKWQVSR